MALHFEVEEVQPLILQLSDLTDVDEYLELKNNKNEYDKPFKLLEDISQNHTYDSIKNELSPEEKHYHIEDDQHLGIFRALFETPKNGFDVFNSKEKLELTEGIIDYKADSCFSR